MNAISAFSGHLCSRCLLRRSGLIEPNFPPLNLIACDQPIAATFADARIAQSRVSGRWEVSRKIWHGVCFASRRDRDHKIGIGQQGCSIIIGEVVDAVDRQKASCTLKIPDGEIGIRHEEMFEREYDLWLTLTSLGVRSSRPYRH